MKRALLLLVLLTVLWPVTVQAQEEIVGRFYLVPVETVGNARGPEYFKWRFNPSGIDCRWSAMDYGFVPTMLVLAHDIEQADHDALVLNADVYAFPEDVDQPVSDPTIDVFFETLHIPTGWLTPSTTYRELLRQLAGMFQFNQRYGGIAADQSGELHSIFDTATLDDRLREMSAQEEEWFYLTLESFGYDRTLVSRNSRLRQLVKQAGNLWEGQSFVMGGVEF